MQWYIIIWIVNFRTNEQFYASNDNDETNTKKRSSFETEIIYIFGTNTAISFHYLSVFNFKKSNNIFVYEINKLMLVAEK